jgi:hypothetical protein
MTGGGDLPRRRRRHEPHQRPVAELQDQPLRRIAGIPPRSRNVSNAAGQGSKAFFLKRKIFSYYDVSHFETSQASFYFRHDSLCQAIIPDVTAAWLRTHTLEFESSHNYVLSYARIVGTSTFHKRR